jgi:hypothetical protein
LDGFPCDVASYRAGIDLIVFPVRPDKSDENPLAAIMYGSDEAVFVPAYIEYHPAVRKYVSAPEHLFYVGRLRPFCRFDDVDPCAKRLFGIASPGLRPEVSKGFDRDDSHDRGPEVLSSPI